MKSDKKILVAFLLNLFFSIFEFIGGIFTGSVAITSDALHDAGDAISIGIAYFLEKVSKKKPDNKYTYGYLRFSVLGSLITTVVLLVGSVIVIYLAIVRLINPVIINYDNMIIIALIGVIVNLLAVLFTKDKHSLNEKAVNLHMLEDVLGWIVVLIGAVVMRFTDFYLLDSILSIIVAIFILVNAFRNLVEVLRIFLLKKQDKIDIEVLKHHILEIEGVIDVHHIHIWTIDGNIDLATLHLVLENYDATIKNKVKEELIEHGIKHMTIEVELDSEECCDINCKINECQQQHSHHHHHHHH